MQPRINLGRRSRNQEEAPSKPRENTEQHGKERQKAGRKQFWEFARAAHKRIVCNTDNSQGKTGIVLFICSA